MAPDDLETKVRHLLREELGVNDDGLTLDTELVTSGLVDSVGLVRLASFLEREANITIPNQDLTVENFDTLRRIQAYTTARLTR